MVKILLVCFFDLIPDNARSPKSGAPMATTASYSPCSLSSMMESHYQPLHLQQIERMMNMASEIDNEIYAGNACIQHLD